MTSKKTAFTLLIAVFIIGFAAGSVTNKLFFPIKKTSHSHRDRSQQTLEKFTRQLNLNPAQQTSLKNLLDTIKVKYDSLRKANSPQYKAVREYFKTEFSKILTQEQLLKYIEMEKEFSERMKKREQKLKKKGDERE